MSDKEYNHVVNAKIESCDVIVERGFMISVSLTVEMESGHQGFGGYVLGGLPSSKSACNNHKEQNNLLAEWVGNIFDITEVERLSDCKGKIIRVGKNSPNDKILAIGHAFKDIWFNPSTNDVIKNNP